MQNGIIENFEAKHQAVWGKQTVKLRHTLPSMKMFSTEGLAGLLDSLPRERVSINTMEDGVTNRDSWSYCERGELSGTELMKAVATGRFWVNMTHLQEVNDDFASLVDAMFAEFQGYMPDFDTFKRSIGLLISSPGAQVFYHCDVPGQALWQVAGRKRIYIYPAEEPFLRPAEVENVIRARSEEEIHYEPWFDDYAEIYDLEPGQMLHWKLNGPHRVVNLEGVNVSITTEHWTPEVRRSYAMNYGNGILRDFGFSPRARRTDGPAFWGKAALTAAWRASGMHKGQMVKRKSRFTLDPNVPSGLAPVPAE